VIEDDGTLIASTGTSALLRISNRPNKGWMRIEDAKDPGRLAVLVNTKQLLELLREQGVLE
jgi:hypothetical protein